MNNFIIHEKSRKYHWSGECFLSVKSFYNGTARYDIGQRQYLIGENDYLLLNDCTKYDLTIDSENDVESFCVFFTPDFVAQYVSESASTDINLLDHSPKKVEGFNLIERKYQHGGPVSYVLSQGRQLSKLTMSKLELEEYYLSLLTAIYQQNKLSLKDSDKLSLKRKSVREEIYRRIYYAKDFIDGNYYMDLTLDEIADVALLSKNHLLRNFNQIFHMSPFQYITQLKIAEAKRQIIRTDKSISDIVFDLGYSSMSNFSHYFKKLVGQSPTKLRSSKKGDR